QQTTDPATKNIEKAILTLNNEISKMRTESEWKSETQTLGRTSITSHRSEYSDGTEAIWVEFTYLFNERRKREGRSPATIYNVLSEEIRLGPATLSGFYRHQKKPHVTTLDKIEAWVDKEGKKKDKFIHGFLTTAEEKKINAISIVYIGMKEDRWIEKNELKTIVERAVTSATNAFTEGSPWQFDNAFEGVCGLYDMGAIKTDKEQPLSSDQIEKNI
ncbi:10981_t:CDS:2, partial [Entrophospora sp. SA101]